MVSGPKPFVHRPTKVTWPARHCEGNHEERHHAGAQREKYETNPISHKPITINELRLVLRPAGKIP